MQKMQLIPPGFPEPAHISTVLKPLWRKRSNRKHVIAVANGTVALELALLALEVGFGDEVIVPALTFAAPAAAVRSVGALPVFADITAESWTIDPARRSATDYRKDKSDYCGGFTRSSV